MANQGLLDRFGQRASDWLTETLTGQPTAGSEADLRQQISKRQLQNSLRDLQANPNDPNARAAFLSSVELLDDSQRRANENALSYMDDPRLKRAASYRTELDIQKEDARAKNDIARLTSAGQQQMLGLDKLIDRDTRLAGLTRESNSDLLNYLSGEAALNRAFMEREREDRRKLTITGLLNSLSKGALAVGVIKGLLG